MHIGQYKEKRIMIVMDKYRNNLAKQAHGKIRQGFAGSVVVDAA